MKNAKKIGIAIVQIVIAGILVFIAIKICNDNKREDVDVGQVAVEEVEQTPVPSETATPESATSETANADGYGEETLVQTEDGSYLDGEASESNEADSNLDVEVAEQPEATATLDSAEATPAPVATPQPTAVSQPAVTAAPQPEQVTQPDQSQDGGVVPDWVDDSWTGVSDEEYNAAGEILGDFEFE